MDFIFAPNDMAQPPCDYKQRQSKETNRTFNTQLSPPNLWSKVLLKPMLGFDSLE
jgi:hypothetical protein